MPEQIVPLFSLLFLAVANQVVIPAPTDLIMLGLAAGGIAPLGLIIFVIVGSSIGAAIDYYIGRFGIETIPWIKKNTNTRNYRKAEHYYKRHGYWTLLFSFFPFVGKYFPFVSGLLKGSFLKTITFYVLGKLLYYGIAAGVLYQMGVLR